MRPKLWVPRSSETGRPLGTETLLSLEAKIKPDFKRAVGLGFLAIACLGVGDNLGGIRRHDHWKFLVIGLTVGFAALGFMAVRSAGRESLRVSAARGGPATASALRLVVSVVGYGIVVLGILQMLNVNLASLLVGGAVTGVVVGIAAQQSLGNFFAGLVLMFARPYVPGQRVIIRSGGMGGPFEGVITDAGLLYTTIDTDDGPINLPNAGLLAAAVGPAPDPVPDDLAGSPVPGAANPSVLLQTPGGVAPEGPAAPGAAAPETAAPNSPVPGPTVPGPANGEPPSGQNFIS